MSEGTIVLLVFIIVLTSWPVILTVMKRVSGWAALEERFPPKTVMQGQKYRFSSICFRKGSGLPFNYGACIIVTAGASGLDIRTFFPFSLSQRPFFLPWSAITKARRMRFLLTRGTALNIKNFDRDFIIWDFTGIKIFEECKKHGVATAE